jgi:acylpyruvate hydrolase
VFCLKLATFEVATPVGPRRRLGAVVDSGYIDLNLSYASYLSSEGVANPYERADANVPANILDFLSAGDTAIRESAKAVAHTTQKLEHNKEAGPRGEKLLYGYSEVKLKAPIPRPPKIISTGLNFKGHIRDGDFVTPLYPAGFVKLSTTVIGSGEPIVYPKVTKMLDYEIELCFIVGRKAKYVTEEEALDYVAGYSVFNDLTARDIQVREQKTGNHPFVSKNLDTFSPMGPFLSLKDEVHEPKSLTMELKVNGEVRQKANTSEMIFNVQSILSYFSCMTLEPGDVITCGTPAGVGYFGRGDPTPWLLKPGDVIEASIERLGTLRNTVVNE